MVIIQRDDLALDHFDVFRRDDDLVQFKHVVVARADVATDARSGQFFVGVLHPPLGGFQYPGQEKFVRPAWNGADLRYFVGVRDVGVVASVPDDAHHLVHFVLTIQDASAYVKELFKARGKSLKRIAPAASYGSMKKDSADYALIRLLVTQPDKTIDLIDEAASRIRMELDSDGTPNQDITAFALVVEGVKFASGSVL